MQVSVIIPVFNESEILPELVEMLYSTLVDQPYPWEILFIDDGSNDNSFELLESFAEGDPDHIIVIGLRRNFGQTAAIAAGIDHSHGDILVLMDAVCKTIPQIYLYY